MPRSRMSIVMHDYVCNIPHTGNSYTAAYTPGTTTNKVGTYCTEKKNLRQAKYDSNLLITFKYGISNSYYVHL